MKFTLCKLIYLLLISITSVSALASSVVTSSSKVDNVNIHGFQPSNSESQLLKKPIHIFNNKKLEGSPVFIIDNISITDLRVGSKNYNFKDYYSYIKRTPLLEEAEGLLFKVKEFPISFIKNSGSGFVIPIETKENEVLKIDGQELFTKLVHSQFANNEISVIWRTDETLGSVHKLKKDDADFAKFMETFSKCVKLKNVECLLNLNEGFEAGIFEWTMLNDPKFCDRYKKDETSFPGKKELRGRYIANWALYEKFLELKSPEIKSRYILSGFGDFYRLTINLVDGNACDRTSQLYLEVTKKKNEKIDIKLDSTTGDG